MGLWSVRLRSVRLWRIRLRGVWLWRMRLRRMLLWCVRLRRLSSSSWRRVTTLSNRRRGWSRSVESCRWLRSNRRTWHRVYWCVLGRRLLRTVWSWLRISVRLLLLWGVIALLLLWRWRLTTVWLILVGWLRSRVIRLVRILGWRLSPILRVLRSITRLRSWRSILLLLWLLSISMW